MLNGEWGSEVLRHSPFSIPHFFSPLRPVVDRRLLALPARGNRFIIHSRRVPTTQAPQPGLTMKSSEAAQFYFSRAADQLELKESMRRRLIIPRREIQVQVSFETDKGEVATYVGYRVQHNNARGPMKGGFR